MRQRGHVAPPATNQSSSDPVNQTSSSATRRRRLLVVPLAIVCVLAFIAGMAVAGGSDERDSVARFGAAWAAGDIDAMYAELNPASQSKYSADDLRAAYDREATTATATAVAVGDTRGPIDQDGTDVVALPTTIQTTAFGEVSGEIAVPVADGGVSWQPNLVFPGLGEGDELISETKVPKRAPILAADRTPLAQGPRGRADDERQRRHRHRRDFGAPARAPAGDEGRRLPQGDPGGHQRPRAGVRRGPLRDPRRQAVRLGRRRQDADRPPSADPRRAGADHDRRRPAGRHGGGARQHLRRRRRAQRGERQRARARRPGLLGPSAARLDVQGDHRHGGSRDRRDQAERGVPGRDRRGRRRGGRSPTPTTSPAAAPCSRASPTPATASSPRSASGSAATRWSRRPSCSASTRRRPSTTPRRWR